VQRTAGLGRHADGSTRLILEREPPNRLGPSRLVEGDELVGPRGTNRTRGPPELPHYPEHDLFRRALSEEGEAVSVQIIQRVAGAIGAPLLAAATQSADPEERPDQARLAEVELAHRLPYPFARSVDFDTMTCRHVVRRQEVIDRNLDYRRTKMIWC